MESLDLPILYEIGLNLKPRDLLNLCQTSGTFSVLCRDDELDSGYFWKLKLQKDFPTEFRNLKKVHKSWRKEYFYKYIHKFLANIENLRKKFENTRGVENRIEAYKQILDYILENYDIFSLPQLRHLRTTIADNIKENLHYDPILNEYYYQLFGHFIEL